MEPYREKIEIMTALPASDRRGRRACATARDTSVTSMARPAAAVKVGTVEC